MLKAVGGGGGRGMRPVMDDAALDGVFETCTREAALSGAAGGVFVEELVEDARHIEVQLLGDGRGGLVHLLERDCSVQRRRQKLLETAPALGLDEETRSRLFEHALAIGRACDYRSAGTCEFLLSGGRETFLEFNPRIQVEHTVSEEATGVDIVQAQLLIAGGADLGELGLSQQHIGLRNAAIQARVQMTAPGRLTAYAEPGGPGLRVDGSLYAGYAPSTRYDPLLTKLIARASASALAPVGASETARRRLVRACDEIHLGGTIQTNLGELRSILESAAFAQGSWTTGTLDELDRRGRDDSPAETATAAAAAAPGAGRAALLEDVLAPLAAASTVDHATGQVGEWAEDEAAPPGCTYVRCPRRGSCSRRQTRRRVASA